MGYKPPSATDCCWRPSQAPAPTEPQRPNQGRQRAGLFEPAERAALAAPLAREGHRGRGTAGRLALGLLTLIFFSQDWMTKHPVLTEPRAHRLSGLHPLRPRLLRQRPALGGQRHDLLQCADQRLPLGLLPDGAVDLPAVVLGRGVASVLGPRRVLRLALPLRRPAGAD